MLDEIINLSKQLIEIPSISGDIPTLIKILEFTKQQLPNQVFQPFVSNNIPSLLFTNQPHPHKEFKIILNAHLDVVPGKPDQYIPVEKDGKLYGRGAYDMKAGAAAMILLFKELGSQLPYPLGLQIVTDEEPGGLNGTNYQVNQGVRGEFVITGEGSNFRIINESKTRLTLKLTANGKASHSAYPWLGDNAIWKLQQVIQQIMEKYPIAKQESASTVVNITKIGTQNDAYNRTPFHAEAILDIRYIKQDQNILQYIESLLPPDIQMDVILKFFTHHTNVDNKYIDLLQLQAKTITGQQLSIARAHASSDMPFYSNIGCDAIEFGVRGGNHHADGEWADIQSIQDYYQILKSFLLAIH
jgi:succinyl-diaminopimelate desuccinylase